MKFKELHIRFDEIGTEGISMKAELKPGSESYDIFFEVMILASPKKNSEALLSVGLLPSMKTGRALVADGTISQKPFNVLDSICDFYCALTI